MRKSYSPLSHGKVGAGTSAGTNERVVDADDSEDYSPSHTESYVELSDNDDSDVANWEEYVRSDGSLFYAEYLEIDDECTIEIAKSHTDQMLTQNKNQKCNQQQQQQTQLLARENEKEHNQRNQLTNEFLFSTVDQSNESCKIVELIITAADRYRFGRRSTATESILGFRAAPFPDQINHLMVDNFVYDVPALLEQDQQQNTVKRGDWFKSLNNFEINTNNVDDVLLRYVERTKVQLQFYGHKTNQKGEVHLKNNNRKMNQAIVPKRIENTESLVDLFEIQSKSLIHKIDINVVVFGLLILPPECYKNDQYKNSLFFYPNDPEKNFLYKARGSFLTLYSVLNEELKTKPISSKLTFDNVQYNVCYRQINGFLVLFSYPSTIIELAECNLRADELITYMNLLMSNISLASFNNRNFENVMINLCKIQQARILLAHKNNFPPPIEDLFKESRYLPLPKEGQLRILDALSEMAAMDYRSWNEEPLTTHREFFICGSVLYYNQLMLVSQMSSEMRLHVEVYLRCHGIFSFVKHNRIKEVYIWLEIALPNLEGRYFLSICVQNHLLLAVILKLFEPDRKFVQKIAPSLFYIEEMQETLNHLIYCGIESLAMFWSTSNKRPETLFGSPLLQNHTNSSKKLDNKQKLIGVTSNSTTLGLNSQSKLNILYDDETLICSSLAGSSLYSLTPSEEASHKRRTPPNNNNRNGDDSGSDSDWENFSQCYRGPLSDLEPDDQASQVKKFLRKEITNITPIKISPGWENSIYYFLYIDNSTSTIFCPHIVSLEILPFMTEIQRNFFLIRDILQRTKHSYRDVGKITGQDTTIIKEYGTTIEICHNNNNADSKGEQAISKIRLAMVGRLFVQPPREVYICHHPDIPYNMVEVAFRLSFFSAG